MNSSPLPHTHRCNLLEALLGERSPRCSGQEECSAVDAPILLGLIVAYRRARRPRRTSAGRSTGARLPPAMRHAWAVARPTAPTSNSALAGGRLEVQRVGGQTAAREVRLFDRKFGRGDALPADGRLGAAAGAGCPQLGQRTPAVHSLSLKTGSRSVIAEVRSVRFQGILFEEAAGRACVRRDDTESGAAPSCGSSRGSPHHGSGVQPSPGGSWPGVARCMGRVGVWEAVLDRRCPVPGIEPGRGRTGAARVAVWILRTI